MRVEGNLAVFATRLFAVGIPGEAGSLVTHWPNWEERIDADTWITQPLIPATNDEAAKGFVAVYDPPIISGQATRIFRSCFTMAREFEATVARGLTGHITYRTRRIAQTHILDVNVVVEVESALPQLEFDENFSPKLALVEANKGHEDGHTYRVYTAVLQNVSFADEYFLEIIVAKSRPK